MKKTLAFCLLSAAAVASTLVSARARAEEAVVLEEPRSRQGYYIGIGLHGGGSSTWDDGESLGQFSGNSFSLRMGQLITRRLSLGLLLEFGGTKKGEVTAGLFGLGFETTFSLVANLSATGSVGFGVLSLNDPTADKDERTRGNYGAAYGLGLTYDFFPWKRQSGGFAVTPTVQARFLPGDTLTSVGVFVGVDLLYYTGLPRNQLQLPENEAYKK